MAVFIDTILVLLKRQNVVFECDTVYRTVSTKVVQNKCKRVRNNAKR